MIGFKGKIISGKRRAVGSEDGEETTDTCETRGYVLRWDDGASQVVLTEWMCCWAERPEQQIDGIQMQRG